MHGKFPPVIVVTDNDVAQGVQLCSIIASQRNAPGRIGQYSDASKSWQEICHYAVSVERKRLASLGLFSKGDFVVSTPGGTEAMHIRRVRSFLPNFEMLLGDQTVGRIAYHNILRTSTTLEFATGVTWTFWKPLFMADFYAESNVGHRLWTQMRGTKQRWNILTQPDASDIYLHSALGFMHREYWTH